MTNTIHAGTHMAGTVHEIQHRHPDHDPVDIERWVHAEYQTHEDDHVKSFVAILVRRAVEERLRRTPAQSAVPNGPADDRHETLTPSAEPGHP